MSMSQEEIEALMNGLDISENEKSSEEESSEDVSASQVDDLISESSASGSTPEDAKIDPEPSTDNDSIDELLAGIDEDDSSDDNSFDSDSIDDLINGINEENDDLDNNEETEVEPSSNVEAASEADVSSTGIVENDDSISMDEIDSIIDDITSEDEENVDVDTSEIDDLIAGLEDGSSNSTTTSTDSEDSVDDFLSGMNFNDDAESIDDIDKKVEAKPEPEEIVASSSSDRGRKDLLDVDQINIPNQLGQVANDSEEKATKIFDALSYILDDNNELRKTVKTLDDFIKSQHKMLEVLHEKFPNVKEFSENLDNVNSLIDKPSEIQSRLNNRDKELFETMELMQFHDINRQKIERVMGVVINLSKQLNAIFDDEDSNKNVPVSKHLPGDSNADLVDGDDLESLIAEYSK